MDRNVVCALIMTFILYVTWTLIYPRRRSRALCPRNARHAQDIDEFFNDDQSNMPATSAANYSQPTYNTTSTANYSQPTYTTTSTANYSQPTYTITGTASDRSVASTVTNATSNEAPQQSLTNVDNLRQSALDFSDIGVTEEQRAEMVYTTEQTGHVQSVNERYDAAKRKVAEYKLKPGVYDNKQRRKLVEALLRRPACGRRVRSWRTENSDTLRGDTIPKTVSSWGLMRLGGSNPAIDLHPGALGALSGMEGRWISEENIPDNTFDDLLI
jgi:hypothetical protein